MICFYRISVKFVSRFSLRFLLGVPWSDFPRFVSRFSYWISFRFDFRLLFGNL